MISSVSPVVQSAVSRYVREIAGIRLPETLYSQVFGFVAERAFSVGIGEILYLERLKHDSDERDLFIQKITIGETFFFRDECQFSFLDRIILPSLATAAKKSSFRAWSAACSSGEEAVSLALLARRHSGPAGFSSVDIWASDINRQSLETLSLGVFRSGSFREEGSGYHWLIEPWIVSRNPLSVTLDQAVLEGVHTARIDLSTCDYAEIPDSLDLVMLRNVLIYLDASVRSLVVDAVVRKLKRGGILFLSASEVPLFEHDELELSQTSGVYYFVKTEKKNRGLKAPPPHLRLPRELSLPRKLQTPGVRQLREPGVPVPSASLSREPGVLKPSWAQDLEPVSGFREGLLERLEKCFILSNAGETSQARIELGVQLSGNTDRISAEQHPAVYFLAGYIYMCEGSTDEARALFDRCLSYHPAFWIARFHRAILSASADPERSRLDFASVARDIGCNGSNGLSGADFLLEGFDCKYFRDISEKWTEKLSVKGARHVH